MQIKISEQSFRYIEVYKIQYQFEKNNSGPVRCRDCRGDIAPGLGIYRDAYKRSGYLCFSCFAKEVPILTSNYKKEDSGFFVDTLGRLRACTLRAPALLTAEIIEAVYNALLEVAHTSIDLLLGAEAAHVWDVGDAAEAMIGRGEG